MADLSTLRVACVANDGVEEAELTETVKALRDSGAQVEVIAPRAGQIQAFKHDSPSIKINVDTTLDHVDPQQYGALLLPGGALNADSLRMLPKVQQLIVSMNDDQKPMAVICHAPWELVSAGVAAGRTMTSYHTIQDDVRNAGARWLDQEVVKDGNLVTSRQPSDIPAFNAAMLELFAHQPHPAMP